MVLRVIKILFDNPEATYYAGQTVSGKLFVKLDSNKKVRGIHVKFRGEAEVRWAETHMIKDAAGKLTPTDQLYRAHEVYFESRYYVLGGTETDVVLQAGDHIYPFSVTLPKSLPSSFEGALGHVRYIVWITLERPWTFNHDIKAAFTVISPLDLNEEPQIEVPVQLSKIKYIGFWCCRSGPIKLTVSIPAAGFVPGQHMPVTVKVDNKTRKFISNVGLVLSKFASFHARLGAKSKTRFLVSDVLGRHLGTVNANSSCKWTEVICVPSLPASYLRKCKIIDLGYLLQARVEIDGQNKRMETHCDIVIGTVPLRKFWPTLSVIPLTPLPVFGPNGEMLPQEIHTDTPSPYPELPPPSYTESVLGPGNIRDPKDNEWLRGELSFTPRYPTYNFDK